MSIRVYQSLQLQISQDISSTPKLLVADYNESFTDSDDHNEATSHIYKLATGVTDQQLGTGSISAIEGMAIICDQDIEIKLNNTDGTDRSITLKANKMSVIHADISAIYASNSSGNEACIRMSIWGD